MLINVGILPCRSSKRVHLDGGLVLPEFGPREQGQAQIDGRGIQCIETLRQIDADWIAGVERSRDPDQNLGEVGKDAPVVRLVGVGQSGTRHLATKAHVIKLPTHGSKARLDVAQTLAIGQLSEGHRQ